MNPDGEERIYIKDHLGSIRVTLDDKLAVIHAEDYDMWGYPLEDRKYETAEEVYKFTGKERDKESGYDYFGARYYNSRIGRWGQVEPLLDKYVSFSPYCYGLNSPMVLKDVDGRDAKVTIDGNSITININVYYISQENSIEYGLSENQIDILKSMKTNIESYWSGEFDIQGKNFTVETIFHTQEVGSVREFNKYYNPVNDNIGFNVALPFDDTKYSTPPDYLGLGIVEGRKIIISEDVNTYSDTPAHEAGHLLGLPDRGFFGNSIMHWRTTQSSRLPPSHNDFKEIFKNKNMQSNEQIIIP